MLIIASCRSGGSGGRGDRLIVKRRQNEAIQVAAASKNHHVFFLLFKIVQIIRTVTKSSSCADKGPARRHVHSSRRPSCPANCRSAPAWQVGEGGRLLPVPPLGDRRQVAGCSSRQQPWEGVGHVPGGGVQRASAIADRRTVARARYGLHEMSASGAGRKWRRSKKEKGGLIHGPGRRKSRAVHMGREDGHAHLY